MDDRLRAVLGTCIALGCIATRANGAEAAPFRFDQLARAGRLEAFSLSPDGRLLAFTVATADVDENRMRSAIWLMPSSGGQARRVTSGDQRDSEPRFSPDGRDLAFLSDHEGGSQIWVLHLAGGEPRKATAFPTEVNAFKWSPDGKFFVFTSDVFPECRDAACLEKTRQDRSKAKVKARVVERLLFRHWTAWKDGTRTHVWRAPAARSGEAVDLTPGNRDAPPFGGDNDFEVSPDGKALVYCSNPDPVEALSTNGDVWAVSFDGGGKAVDLTEGNKAFDGTPRFSPDGKWIAYRAQRRPGFESDLFRLMVYDRATRQSRCLTEGFDDWVEDFAWAPDSKALYFETHLAARGAIFRVPLSGGSPIEIWRGGGIAGLRCSPDGRRLFFAQSTLTRAAELWTVGTDGKDAMAVSHVNDTLFADAAMGSVSERFTPSADGRKLQAWVIQPPGFDPSRKYPAIFLIHGGPQGAWTDSWSYRWNPEVWAAYGYVIYAPNPRGSTGWGQNFVDEISGDWGGKPYDDLMRQADDLASLPYVDRSRIGAAGASYGGYMIDWIAGHTDRFQALFSHDGLFDSASAGLETEELWFPVWEFRGWPWSSDIYAKWNPMRFAENFKTPTLVVTSEKDFRVPFGQGLQFFTALQVRGIPSELLTFPDEGHWILKPGNSRLWHNVVMDWFHRWLGGAEADPKALETIYSVTR
jgi:dipeptidyl aminopeptidase/acylaminoacyl peptidase